VYFLQNAEGAGLAPFDCWLALRGLKTMALRQERQADNCLKLAHYLAKHPLVKRINYAGGCAGRRACRCPALLSRPGRPCCLWSCACQAVHLRPPPAPTSPSTRQACPATLGTTSTGGSAAAAAAC
jgi:hypothetical protein